MAHQMIRNSVATALALTAMTACNGDSNMPPPQTPADQTTTTGASTTDPATLANATTSPAAQGNVGTGGTYGAATTAGSAPDNSGTIPGSTASGASMTGQTGGNIPGIATPTSDANNSGAATDASLDDGQIVAIVQAADTGEIEQAREALHKAKNARVKHFAQHMVSDHSAAETKLAGLDTKAGITPQTSTVAERIKSNGQQVMTDLKSSGGSDFDKTYMDAQVKEHTKVLDALDNKLIPKAQNADLVKALQDIRSKVAAHLKDAQDIQSSLGQSQ